MSDLFFERTPKGIATPTLDRPEARAAFGFGMQDSLIELLAVSA